MMAALRILQIAHDHPDWTTGGTEIVAHDLHRALERRGLNSTFLAAATSLQRPEAVAGSLGRQGGDVVLRTGGYDRFLMNRLDGLRWLDSLRRLVADTRPEVVHLHGIDRIGAEVIPALRRLAPAARIVLTLHDYQIICPNDGLLLTRPEIMRCRGASPDGCRSCFPDLGAARHALRKTYLATILQGVDLFLAPSRFLRDRFLDWGLPAGRVRLMPNAVAPLALMQDRPRVRRDRFAFFGSIAPHKGVLTLLDAAAQLKAEGAALRLALHGGLRHPTPEFRGAFDARLAAAQPLAQHLGPYDRNALASRMADVDWVVVPSLWWENAPLVILEAQAAGRPVIASGVGGMAELVRDGATGLLVPPGDASALAETLRAAAEDAPLWARLAGSQPRASHEAFVDAHLDVYRSLHEGRRAA
ncbi:glycosyltransferase family 4 protein [Cereibacter sphaeroides]|uniref:glycosyltransferase family 4 protein n=1 Tax=Cereibacter sphaeroides TaxID=1063 RepID=UPI001F28EA5D|nr:glycosyltransferase family 4 protein [Cereibacter sphaeroides]MCE6958580.1 glycosyltransferase family 4 protein [Cereibacter sphaeroides]MCE6972377.1 glycosyltransferase family 4 protein [Cereibacter sphaeroides]